MIKYIYINLEEGAIYMDYNEKDIKDLLMMGIMKCPACGMFSLKYLAINTKTQEKYMHCHTCKTVIPISDENFNNVLIVGKEFPQDANFIDELFEEAYRWWDNNLPESIKDHDELQKIADEYGEKLFHVLGSKYHNLNNRFLSNTINNAFDCYIENWINAMKKAAEENNTNSEKKNNKKKDTKTNSKNSKPKKEKKSTKNSSSKKSVDGFEKIILSDYHQTVLKFMSVNPDFFAIHPIKYNCIVSPSEKSATFNDLYGGYTYTDIPDELMAVRLVHSLCMLYQFLLQYKNNYPDYDNYNINKKYKVDWFITSSEVHISSVKGFGLFGHDDNLYAKVIIDSFNSVLDLFSTLYRTYRYDKPLSYGKIIKDFIDNEYYLLGIDVGSAVFIFKNYKYFKEYIDINDDIEEFINIINNSKNIADLLNKMADAYSE